MRLAWLTLGLAPVVLGSIVAFFWVQSNVPRWVYWKVGLILLIMAEIAYVLALTFAIPGTLLVGAVLIDRRRKRQPALKIARWFLLGMSVLLALAMAEVAGVMLKRLSHPASALPPGDLAGRDPATRIAMAPAEIELPTRFPEPPGDRKLDVVVMGESSAQGIPYQNWLSIGQLLKWQLGEILPDRPIRVEVLALSGEDLEQQHHRLARIVRRPDLLIVYCGHNEFSARFHAMRDLRYYIDDQQPGLREVLVDRLERISPLCGLVHSASEKCRIAIPPSPESPRPLVDVPVFTASEYQALIEQFQRRLNTITSYAQSVGAIPVLIAPPANDAGFEPNRSYLPAYVPRAQRDAFAREFLAIHASESSDPRGCIDRYRVLLGTQPGFAEAHYRLARLLSAAGNWDEAYTHFVAARDDDGYPMRALSSFQQVYRDVARRRGCVLIDGQAVFHAIGPHGMLDDSLFHDAMHPSLRGYIALAQAVLQELHAAQAFGWPPSVSAPIIDPARCAAYFGVGRNTWRHLCHWGLVFYDVMAPLRYDSSMRYSEAQLHRLALEQIDAGIDPLSFCFPNLGIPEPVPPLPSSLVSSGP